MGGQYAYTGTVPLYEYRCRDCESTFELRRSMSESNDPAPCPQGHANTVRLLSVFASVGAAAAGGGGAPAPMPSGGGCGAGCGCAH
jgi:putative FmdB family regulatory protein